MGFNSGFKGLRERWIIRGWVEEGSVHGCLSPKGPRWWRFGVGGWGIPITVNIETYWKKSSGNGTNLATEALLGRTEWGSFTGHRKGYVKNALETGIWLYGGSVGPTGFGSFARDFERGMKGCCGIGASLCEGALGRKTRGKHIYWGTKRLCRERLWRRAFLAICVPL